jgi:hypothetical protein
VRRCDVKTKVKGKRHKKLRQVMRDFGMSQEDAERYMAEERKVNGPHPNLVRSWKTVGDDGGPEVLRARAAS